MKSSMYGVVIVLTLVAMVDCGCTSMHEGMEPELPSLGQVRVDKERCEILLHALVQHPSGQPCIDNWGQRTQSFVGCKYAAGGDASLCDWFVFLVDASTEQVYEGLIALGAIPLVHYPIPEAKKRSGLTPATKPDDFLQGDPVLLSIFWEDEGEWKELPYEAFVKEKVSIRNSEIIKPWTPHFVFHGSGAIYATGTGCLACPCDCAGGIIADNRNPIFDPKPVVKFDWSKAPEVGSEIYVRIRPVCSRGN